MYVLIGKYTPIPLSSPGEAFPSHQWLILINYITAELIHVRTRGCTQGELCGEGCIGLADRRLPLESRPAGGEQLVKPPYLTSSRLQTPAVPCCSIPMQSRPWVPAGDATGRGSAPASLHGRTDVRYV